MQLRMQGRLFKILAVSCILEEYVTHGMLSADMKRHMKIAQQGLCSVHAECLLSQAIILTIRPMQCFGLV